MAILKYANQSGVVYAYKSVSEWDPQKKQSRSKRKCLGRVDPDTGEIIPTSGKRGRPSKKMKDPSTDSEYSELMAAFDKLKADHEAAKKQNLELLQENKKLRMVLSRIKKDVSDI